MQRSSVPGVSEIQEVHPLYVPVDPGEPGWTLRKQVPATVILTSVRAISVEVILLITFLILAGSNTIVNAN